MSTIHDIAAQAAEGGWPEPLPLDSCGALPGFEPDRMIPETLGDLRALITTAAETFQVPIEMPAMMCLGLGALASSRTYYLECKPDWLEPSQLWCVVLLEPGDRKSAAVRALTAPLFRFEEEERERMRRPVAAWCENRAILEAKRTRLRAAYAREADPGKAVGIKAEIEKITEAVAEMPEVLEAPRIVLQAFTPEGLRDLLAANGEKAGIVSAEVDPEDLLGARYTKSGSGPNIDLLLAGHAGDPHTTRRANGRTIALESPAISMALAVQRTAMQKVLANPVAHGRGMDARFLLLAPLTRMGGRLIDTPVLPPLLTHSWGRRIRSILEIPWPGRVVLAGKEVSVHEGEPLRRILSPEADAELRVLRQLIEPRLGPRGDLNSISGFASKLPGACARIALVFSMLEDPRNLSVSGECMRAACAWAEMLIAHHLLVMDQAGEKPEIRQARRLLERLRGHGKPEISARDAFALIRDSAVPDMRAMRPIIDVLVDMGWIRPLETAQSRPGRPSTRYVLHPQLRGEPDPVAPVQPEACNAPPVATTAAEAISGTTAGVSATPDTTACEDPDLFADPEICSQVASSGYCEVMAMDDEADQP